MSEAAIHIIVCIKQVPDPEGPPGALVINEDLVQVEPRGIPPVLSLFDENALEAAVRIRQSIGQKARVSVLSIGRRVSNAVMQKALASGADELVKVEDERFALCSHDTHTMSSALAKAIRKMGRYDLILTGRQSADWNHGQTGIGVAALLGIPAITLARKIDIASNEVFVERVVHDGYELVKAPLPALVMVSNEVGALRYPTIPERREAAKKPITVLSAEDIGFEQIRMNMELRNLEMPRLRTAHCTMIEGNSPAESAKKLTILLRSDRII